MAAPGQTTSPIQLDASKALIVITCTEHDWWRSSRFHLDEAQDAACLHEEREHPGDTRHREARRLRAIRRVAAASTPKAYEPGARV